MAYNLRDQGAKNYKQLEEVSLTQAQRVKAADPNALYRIKVLERRDDHVKVHWIGYTHKNDEWIAADSLTTLDEGAEGTDVLQLERYSPFNIHEELAYRIKAALTSGTKDSVEVKIELPFDPIIYTGGLQQQGKFLKRWGRNNIQENRKTLKM